MDYALINSLVDDEDLVGTDAEVADAINAITVDTPNGRMVQKRTFIGELPADANGLPSMAISVLAKLRAAAADAGFALQPVLAEVVPMIEQTGEGQGVQMTERTLSIVAVLATVFTPASYRLTADEAAAIRHLGVTSTPWPFANGFGRALDHADVAKARNT